MANVTVPDVAMSVSITTAGIAGIVANGILICLIVFNKELRGKDYIPFILNRALADLTSCLLYVTLHPVTILLFDPTSTMCAAAGYLGVVAGQIIAFSEPLLACNRYVSTLRSDLYAKIYTRRNICLMCVFVWVLAFLVTLPHVFVGSLGRESGMYCSMRFEPETLPVVLSASYSFAFGSLGLVIFFNYKMFVYLHEYQNQPMMSNSQKTKLQSDRDMLRFIFVSAFLPMMFETPGAIILCIKMVKPISGWYLFAGICLFLFSSIVAPVVTLCMVPPIRRHFVKQWQHIVGRTTVSAIRKESARRRGQQQQSD